MGPRAEPRGLAGRDPPQRRGRQPGHQDEPPILAISRMVQAVPEFADRPPGEAMIRYLLRGVLGFYLLMPVALSSISAAFSIVSEKQQRTLEPILATPITDRELLLGKLLASLLLAVALTWASALAAAIAPPGKSRAP